MRFRRPPRQKWFYPFILCSCSTLGYVAVTSGLRDAELLRAGAIVFVMTAYSIHGSWEAWSARIDVDQQGVRWQEGEHGGGLFWKEISGLVRDGAFLGLVEKGTGRTLCLPFVTRPLYDALAKRLRPLAPEQERVLFAELPAGD